MVILNAASGALRESRLSRQGRRPRNLAEIAERIERSCRPSDQTARSSDWATEVESAVDVESASVKSISIELIAPRPRRGCGAGRHHHRRDRRRRDSRAAPESSSRKPDGIIFCGGVLLAEVFRLAGAAARDDAPAPLKAERLEPGAVAAEIDGVLGGLLIGERIALNFVQLMSGIATTTRRYVDAMAGTGARIIDTRKTHPGLRVIEKYAVRAGGGGNHRFGLDSGVLIKENHIAAAGSVGAALEARAQLAPHTFRIEIECETLAQVEEALATRRRPRSCSTT